MMIDLTSVYKLHCVFRSLLIFGKGCINAFGCRIEDRLALTRHLFLRFSDFEGRAKRKMFDFVFPRDCRKGRVTDTFHCDAIRIALLY
jgi:hypothetical protein